MFIFIVNLIMITVDVAFSSHYPLSAVGSCTVAVSWLLQYAAFTLAAWSTCELR